ncbi:hypothetical protein N7523_005739 [Penicillium sp. IBT 18751x]|nr:hypothetical protein N7523_005739 [Penicillium sp. IBT 18751x]
MIPQGIFEALIQQALSDFTPELKGLFSEYKWLNVRLYSSFVGLYGKRKRLVQMLKVCPSLPASFRRHANVKEASIKMDADPFLRTVLQDAYHRVCNGLHESLDLEMRFRHFIINTQNPRSAVRELGIPKQASALAIFRGLSISNRDNRSVYSREFMLVYPQTHRKLIKDDSREDALKDAKKGASS